MTQIARTCDRCGLPFHTGGLSAHTEADCIRALRAAYEGAVQAGRWLKRERDAAIGTAQRAERREALLREVEHWLRTRTSDLSGTSLRGHITDHLGKRPR